MNDCIFCKIISGEIPSTLVFENDYLYAFRDINPLAPVHVVICPKEHIECCDDIDESNVNYVTEIFKAIPQIASNEGLVNGYRVVTNCKEDGCQSVKHLHFHLLGGTKLKEELN